MRVESECVETPEDAARSVAEEFPDKDVADFEDLLV